MNCNFIVAATILVLLSFSCYSIRILCIGRHYFCTKKAPQDALNCEDSSWGGWRLDEPVQIPLRCFGGLKGDDFGGLHPQSQVLEKPCGNYIAPYRLVQAIPLYLVLQDYTLVIHRDNHFDGGGPVVRAGVGYPPYRGPVRSGCRKVCGETSQLARPQSAPIANQLNARRHFTRGYVDESVHESLVGPGAFDDINHLCSPFSRTLPGAPRSVIFFCSARLINLQVYVNIKQ